MNPCKHSTSTLIFLTGIIADGVVEDREGENMSAGGRYL